MSHHDPAAPVPTAATLDGPFAEDRPEHFDAPAFVGEDIDADSPVTSGMALGRYIVVQKVGVGAMGVVLSAFDPKLDRRVAVKLLRSSVWSARGASGELVREAKALAKLSHPNVVAVHDVGMHEGHVFVAMEFVEGQTLRRWLREGPRSWSEVLDVFLAAGRGLVAAHGQGLVHRDFKPDNVMVGHDGRARVMDFGLARPPTGPEARATAPDATITETSADVASLLVGTPAYMAPEQVTGQGATAVSDQFAFCVALYEGLYGVRPFAMKSVQGLLEAQREGRFDVPAVRPEVPRWLGRVLARGLAYDPSDRFPDMQALLRALESGMNRRSRRLLLTVGGVAVLGAAAVPVSQAWEAARARIVCSEEAGQVGALYGAPERDAIVAAFEASGVAYARQVSARVPASLEVYLSDLQTHTEAVCMAARVEGDMLPHHVEKAQWCLSERTRVFGALVSALAVPDERMVRHAVTAVSELGPVDACVDPRSLDGAPRPPAPEVRAAMGPIQDRLASANACAGRGDHACSLRIAHEVMPRIAELGDPNLLAGAQQREGAALVGLGRPSEAERAYTLAYENAVLADAWEMASVIAASQSLTVGLLQTRRAEGELWSTLAKVAAQRAGDPHRLLEANRQMELGAIRMGAGDPAAAAEAFSTAVDHYTERLPDEHPTVARARYNLASSWVHQGHYADGVALLRDVLETQERSLGPAHPDLVPTRDALTRLLKDP